MSKFHEVAVRADLAVCEGLLRCRHALSLPSESPGTPRVRFCRTVESTPTRSLKSCWLRILTSHAALGLLTGAVFLLINSSSTAQVFDAGPSDSSLFTTVINLPPDPNIGDGEGIGDSTQLNIAAGGVVGDDFTVNSGGEVNIRGGLVGQSFETLSGSEVNISGGTVDDRFIAGDGSVVDISGGTVGAEFEVERTSEVTIRGGTVGRGFRYFSPIGNLGKVELIGGEFMLNGMPYTDSTITLARRPPGIFTGTLADGSSFIFTSVVDALNEVTLTPAPLPPLDITPQVVNSDITAASPAGLRAGQTMTARSGGVLGDNFAVVDAMLNIEGGDVGDGLEIAGGTVNIRSGDVGEFFAYTGSEVNISGGNVAKFGADGSDVIISGGTVGDHSAVGGGSVVITGGNVGMFFRASSVVDISGGSVGDRMEAPSGSVVNISDGSVGEFFEAQSGSVVNISGGSVGESFRAHSVVNISGGELGNRFDAFTGSVVNVSGGNVSDGFNANDGSVVNLRGGSVGNDFDALPGSVIKISGGSVGEGFSAFHSSEVHLFGTEFFLDGTLLDTLVQDEPFIITNRGGQILSGTLANGSAFRFVLDETRLGEHYFSIDTLLTVTLVPEPSSAVLLLLAGGGLLARWRCSRRAR